MHNEIINCFQAMIKQKQLTDLVNLDNSVKELRKFDIQLNKHIKDMEDFEISSKTNRSKLLSGEIFLFDLMLCLNKFDIN